MGKLFIICILLNISWCEDQQKDVVKNPSLEYLKDTQKDDGSWGEKHKISFTSISLLTFLCAGETPASKDFGPNVKEAILYLMNQTAPKDPQDYFLHIWALSEAYALTGVQLIETSLNTKIKNLQSQVTMNYWSDSNLFLIQNEALRSLWSAGCEDPNIKIYYDKLKLLKDENSIVLIAAKARWGLRKDIPMNIVKAISKGAAKKHKSLFTDIMYSFISFHYPKRWSEATSCKIESYLLKDHIYQHSQKLIDKDKELLNVLYPAFYCFYSYPERWLPTVYYKNKQSQKTEDIEELNLVD